MLVNDCTQNGSENVTPAVPPVKHDWYQTESQVIVTVMAKNVPKDGVCVNFTDKELNTMIHNFKILTTKLSVKSVSVSFLHSLFSSSPTFSRCNDLDQMLLCGIRIPPPPPPPPSSSSPLAPAVSHTGPLADRHLVEIKMKKTDGIRWEKLEGEGQESNIKHFNPNQHPTSSNHAHKWDKMVVDISEEEKSENLEGDAALNKLFQQIYSDGTDEVKRAMNKSFMESGGTVLSTNWKDVGKRKVDVNPPDDAEVKKY
ncbi:unnamed protein product [Pleuronectes platessa]|uniref:Uncharacterized protein n=1 Tax=Pleuronectes platessa TaxID=8262 RepID=A0A9N7TP40_PLEPL|nr:unnamed protein product [Pleuronectes platessa]